MEISADVNAFWLSSQLDQAGYRGIKSKNIQLDTDHEYSDDMVLKFLKKVRDLAIEFSQDYRNCTICMVN